MIVTECLFDPRCDVKAVDSFGWIDLASAYDNKTVPADSAASDMDYNGIDDPDSILGKPSDVFDALRMQDYVSSVSSSDETKSE